MNDSNLEFAYPVWIVIGVILVILGYILFLKADRKRRADLDKLAHPRFHSRLVAGWSPTLRWVRRGLWLTAVFALAVAAARPQYGHEWREVKRRGIDILFAMDTSRSMLAEDLVPNRLERSRLGILDFLDRLEGDRVGLVPFAGTAFALCPLTTDYDAFRESLNSLNTDLIPRHGTDLASAIREADRLFDTEANNQRFLVLITDGEDLEGEALKAAEESGKLGTKIYTVGVGAKDGQRIPVRDAYGRQSYLRDDSGQEVRTKLDSETLQKIAEKTGGLYVPLGRKAEGLEAIYQKRLALAPKSEVAQKLEKVPLERFQWPLGLAFFLLAIQVVMGERKPERKKKLLVSAARRVKPVVVLLLGFILTINSDADDVDQYNNGTEAYGKGEFKQAVEKLKSSLNTSDLSLQKKAYYNLGNSLYRLGQSMIAEKPDETMDLWAQAIKAYDDSLMLDSADDDAKYNRDFVQKKLDELKQQEQEKKDQQQNQENQNQNQDQNDQQGQDGEQGQKGQKSQNDEQGQEQKGQDSDKREKGDPDTNEGDEQKNQEGEKQTEEKQSKEEGKPEEDKGLKGQEEKQPQANDSKDEEGQPQEGESSKGEITAQNDKESNANKNPAAGAEVGQAGEERKEGEMSKEEAIRLLKTLGDDERVVIPVPLSEQNRKRNNQRKTW